VTSATFAELVTSRKGWIESVLRPWCRLAARRELLRAEAEWTDIAGRADPGATLWTWAWSRFPDLVHEGLSGVSETHEVRLILRDGAEVIGFPDARRSQQGQLYLVCRLPSGGTRERGPHSIDDIVSVTRMAESPR
jgi:hypothetical protein